jgi:hypothetical protein
VPNSENRPPVVIDMHVEAFGDSRDETTEIDRDEWDAMTPAERAAMVQECADEFAASYVAWGWNIADEADAAAADDQATPDSPSVALVHTTSLTQHS